MGGPPIPEGRTLIRAEGDGSREVVLTLDDGSRHTTTAPPFPTDLALRCLHTLSLLLPADDFASFLRTTTQWKQSVAGSSDMDAIAGVLTSLFLGTAPEPSPEKPWEHFVRATADKAARDPLLANLRSSGATQAAPGAATMAPTDRKYLETIVWGFHLLAEDCKLVAEMHQDHSTLVSLLFPLAAALGLVNWFDSYRRISGGSPVVLPSGSLSFLSLVRQLTLLLDRSPAFSLESSPSPSQHSQPPCISPLRSHHKLLAASPRPRRAARLLRLLLLRRRRSLPHHRRYPRDLRATFSTPSRLRIPLPSRTERRSGDGPPRMDDRAARKGRVRSRASAARGDQALPARGTRELAPERVRACQEAGLGEADWGRSEGGGLAFAIGESIGESSFARWILRTDA